MIESRLRALVRNFPENGLKLLLEDGANLRDVMTLDRYPDLARFDFDKVKLDRTTYIQPDFRHIMTDLVYRLPFREGHADATTELTVYLLLEHESEPEEWASLWLLGYLSAIYLGQHRTAAARGLLKAGWQLQPVLPVVLYTGSRTWDQLTPFTELVAGAGAFLPQVPRFAPRFVNIAHLTEQEIDRRSTGFGQVLSLLRQRHKQTGFAPLLARAVRQLERLRATQRTRWLELLSYLHALVYHGRARAEREQMYRVIREAVQTDPARKEVQFVEKTIAMDIEEQGMAKGELRSRQEILLLLLEEKFHKVPKGVATTIQATQDVKKLTTWLKRFATARRLADVGIPPAP